MAVRKKKNKRIEDYNSEDLLDYWCNVYQCENFKPYQYHGPKFREQSLLKSLLNEYDDVYIILLAMEEAIQSSFVDSISVFCDRITHYIPQTRYTKFLYYISHYNDNKKIKNDEYQEIKNKLYELNIMESKWMLTAKDIEYINKLESELNQWIDTL